MISPTAEYALRAIVALAQAGDEAMVTKRIAEVTGVPAGYLAKILQVLGRQGLVRSKRGLGGGFVLAKHRGEITILEVVNAVDPIRRIKRCPLGLETHGDTLCRLHDRLDAATALVEHAFAATTVADLLADTSRSTPFCRTPDSKQLKVEPWANGSAS